jgi:hypothetical protein
MKVNMRDARRPEHERDLEALARQAAAYFASEDHAEERRTFAEKRPP